MPIDWSSPLEAPMGTFVTDLDPGIAETAAQVKAGLSESAAANDEYQAQARQFIVENGAAVLDGHSPVNPAPDELMGQGTGEMYDAG